MRDIGLDGRNDGPAIPGAAVPVDTGLLRREALTCLRNDVETDRSGFWRCLDFRSRRAFRRGHLAGSIHVSAARLARRLYLLPPRGRPVCALDEDVASAGRRAEELAGLGWRHVGFAPFAFPDDCLRDGDADTVLWEPAPLLRDPRLLAGFPAHGNVLDLACGSGRNAVYLAGPGRRIFGVDILPDALSQARIVRDDSRRAARARGVLAKAPEVRFHLADLSQDGDRARWLRPGRWNAVLVFRYLDREILPLIQDSLAPGGHLVYQTFLREQRERKGSPRSDRHLLAPGELRAAFRSLEVLTYDEGEDEDGNVLASLWARRSRV